MIKNNKIFFIKKNSYYVFSNLCGYVVREIRFRTLDMVKPLLKEKDYQLVVDAIKELKENEGPKLQAILEKR